MALKSGQVMDEACLESLVVLQDYDQKAGNPPYYYLPEDELARWKAATQPVIDKWVSDMEGQGLPGQAVYEDVLELSKKYTEMYPPVSLQ